MNTIIEKIKDSIVVKVVVGVLTFLMTNFVTLNDVPVIQEKENYSTEIMFDAKFLDMNNIYLDNDLHY